MFFFVRSRCGTQRSVSSSSALILPQIVDDSFEIPTTNTRLSALNITMTSTSSNCNYNVVFSSLPATKALEEQQQRKRMVAREGRHASLENKLSLELFSLTFDDEVHSFPVIEWESADESDSDSVRSLDSWNSLMTKSDSTSSLGKRNRNDGSRRLVRSKKIKSNLSSLALGLSA